MTEYKDTLLAEKEKLEKLIAVCAASDNSWDIGRLPLLKENLVACEKKLDIIGIEEHGKIVSEMKYFVNLNRDLDSKYSCRTVRALYAIAEWCEKPRAHGVAKWCRDFAMKKIHAPVCSIGKPPVAKYNKPASVVNTVSDREKELMTCRDILDKIA